MEIITFDIYIQEVLDLGRGKINAVLSEFLIFNGITVCIEIYKKDILLHTSYKHDWM